MASQVSSQRGAVAVMVAALLPVFALLLAFAVDASHWWVHKAHLQTQVDAGVWAGAFGPWFPECDNTIIEQTARRYSGDHSGNYVGADPLFNEQYSNETNVHVLVNADKFESQGGTEYADGGTPCASLAAGDGHLDLKASESDLPNFLGSIPGFSVLPWISDLANARARVELRLMSSTESALPVAVPDPNPVAGAALFIDEEDGTIIADGRAELLRGSFTTLNGKPLVEWATDPTTVTIREKTGVVIALSGNANWTWTSGTLGNICTQPLVECYEGLDVGPYKGLGYVHGYPRQVNAVTVGDVVVTNSSCGDDSAPYFILNAGCSVGIEAQVQFPAGATQTQVSVANSDMGCSGGQPSGCALTLVGGYWTGDGVLGVPSAGGALDLRLNWRYRMPGPGGPISGGAVVARVYSASDDPLDSGPVEYMRVYDPSTLVDKHSINTAPEGFIVKIAIQGSLEYESTVSSNPPTRLRVIGGSQNQSLDCDPDYSNLADELANGCRPRYAVNEGEECPANRTALWGSAPPWRCVAVQTGNATNQVPKGMNMRVLGDEQPSSCPPPGEFGHNNWNLNGDSVPDYVVGDPRLLLTFVTPFGSFTGSGEDVKPVTNFAMFYVTGWTGQGQGFNNPCLGNGDDTPPGPAYIVGHFVKYVGPFPGGGGEESCVIGDPAVIAPCVAVLTD